MPAVHDIGAAPTDQDIHDRIFDALLDRRLQPGMRLGEDELARLFGVSRTKVRGALARLAQDGVVEIRRNAGASVASPTEAHTRHVFALRTMVEPSVAAGLASRHTRQDLAMLRRHMRQEDAARAAGDEAALIRLTGAFHLLLAERAGNPLVRRLLRELEALTCLAILRFAPTASSACPCDEHSALVAAIAAADAPRAEALMRSHLDHVLAGLDFKDRPHALTDALASYAPTRDRSREPA